VRPALIVIAALLSGCGQPHMSANPPRKPRVIAPHVCRFPPYVQTTLQAYAGPDARDCGCLDINLGPEANAPVETCIARAFRDQKPFFATSVVSGLTDSSMAPICEARAGKAPHSLTLFRFYSSSYQANACHNPVLTNGVLICMNGEPTNK